MRYIRKIFIKTIRNFIHFTVSCRICPIHINKLMYIHSIQDLKVFWVNVVLGVVMYMQVVV